MAASYPVPGVLSKADSQRRKSLPGLSAVTRHESAITDFSAMTNLLRLQGQNQSSQLANNNTGSKDSDIDFASKTNSLLQLSRTLPAQLVQAHAKNSPSIDLKMLQEHQLSMGQVGEFAARQVLQGVGMVSQDASSSQNGIR